MSTDDNTRERVGVVGHINPDTDSVCSALAYAYLKNAIDPSRVYTPYRAGHLSDETAFVLKYFGLSAPSLIENVWARIDDIAIRHLETVREECSLKDAWELFKKRNVLTIPVTQPGSFDAPDGEKLIGLVTVKDIGRVYLDNNDPDLLSKAKTPISNIVSVLDGTLEEKGKCDRVECGRVFIAAAEGDLFAELVEKGDVIIVSNREEMQRIAIKSGASCIIVTLGAPVSDAIRALAIERGCAIISTKNDTYITARLVNQSVPVSYIMIAKEIVGFDTRTYLNDVKKTMAKKGYRDFPVIDADSGNYAGMISRRFLLDAAKRKMILVDHNEKTQAVAGIEETAVVEIIDHHRIGSIETIDPVYFRNQPLGATCTIIAGMFDEFGVAVPREIAGALCAGIVSDTLMFRSPTTADQDIAAAEKMAGIAGVNLESFAFELFHAGNASIKDRNRDELRAFMLEDFKNFQVSGRSIGIAQVKFIVQEQLERAGEMFEPLLDDILHEKNLDMLFVMLTDIPGDYSRVIFAGEEAAELLEEAFERKPKNSEVVLDKMVSRKKQFVPGLLVALYKYEGR